MFIRTVNIPRTFPYPIKDLVNSDIHGKDTRQGSNLHQTTLSKRYLLYGH